MNINSIINNFTDTSGSDNIFSIIAEEINNTVNEPSTFESFLQREFGHTFINAIDISINHPPISPIQFIMSPLTSHILPSFPVHITQMVQQESFDEKKKYKHIISEEGLKKIELIPYEKTEHTDICPITYDKFKDGDTIARLPCKHIFEHKAILKWLTEESACCPICRTKFDSIEVKIEKDVSFNTSNTSNILTNNVHSPTPLRVATNQLVRLVNRRIEEEEEHILQRAILASIEDQHNIKYKSD